MSHVSHAAAAACLLLAGGAAYAADVSGTYVGKYSNAAELLQIIERPDGSIVGHYEEIALSSDNTKTTMMNASMTGAVDGGTVVLTLKPAQFLGGTIPLSGSFDGNFLHLSGGANGNSVKISVQRSTEAAFNQYVEQLTVVAAQTEELKNIIHVTQEMRTYSKKAAIHLQKGPELPKLWARRTAKLQAELEREQSLPVKSFGRGQIDISIRTARYYFSETRDTLRSFESSLGYSNGKIMNSEVRKGIQWAQVYCVGPGRAIPFARAHGSDRICQDFDAVYASYRVNVAKLETIFSAAESSWNAEDAKQQAIEKESAALQ